MKIGNTVFGSSSSSPSVFGGCQQATSPGFVSSVFGSRTNPVQPAKSTFGLGARSGATSSAFVAGPIPSRFSSPPVSQSTTGMFGNSTSVRQPTAGLFGMNSQASQGATGMFGNTPAGQSAPGVFGQISTSNVFDGQPGSVFGVGSTATSSVFGGHATFPHPTNTTASATPSTFGSAVGNQVTSVFGQTMAVTGNSSTSFGQLATPGSVLGQPTNTESLFQSTPAPPSKIGQPVVSAFATFTTGTADDPQEQEHVNAYTELDQLTEEELKAFEALTFEIGKIPMRPPPKQLCF